MSYQYSLLTPNYEPYNYQPYTIEETPLFIDQTKDRAFIQFRYDFLFPLLTTKKNITYIYIETLKLNESSLLEWAPLMPPSYLNTPTKISSERRAASFYSLNNILLMNSPDVEMSFSNGVPFYKIVGIDREFGIDPYTDYSNHKKLASQTNESSYLNIAIRINGFVFNENNHSVSHDSKIYFMVGYRDKNVNSKRLNSFSSFVLDDESITFDDNKENLKQQLELISRNNPLENIVEIISSGPFTAYTKNDFSTTFDGCGKRKRKVTCSDNNEESAKHTRITSPIPEQNSLSTSASNTTSVYFQNDDITSTTSQETDTPQNIPQDLDFKTLMDLIQHNVSNNNSLHIDLSGSNALSRLNKQIDDLTTLNEKLTNWRNRTTTKLNLLLNCRNTVFKIPSSDTSNASNTNS